MRKGTRREGEETPVGSRTIGGEVTDPFLGTEEDLMKGGMITEITTDLKTDKEHLKGTQGKVLVTDTETITEIREDYTRREIEIQQEIERETEIGM